MPYHLYGERRGHESRLKIKNKIRQINDLRESLAHMTLSESSQLKKAIYKRLAQLEFDVRFTSADTGYGKGAPTYKKRTLSS